jgi:ribosome biogenesis GTPase
MDAPGEPRRVVRHDGVKVLVSDGESVEHVAFPRSMQIAVGNWVLVQNETVTSTLPRRSLLKRDHEERGPQLIAANIDVVIVIFGADRPLRRPKVTRFVALAWDIGAQPIVIVSKTDIAQDPNHLVSTLTEWLPGVEILATSIETGEGVEGVAAALAGRTGTFIGESGAGKSSLVNVLMEDEVAWVGEVRETDAKGRHVTSHRELHLLPNGGMIIDNPGVRSLGLTAEGDGVDALYADIEELMCSLLWSQVSCRGIAGAGTCGSLTSSSMHSNAPTTRTSLLTSGAKRQQSDRRAMPGMGIQIRRGMSGRRADRSALRQGSAGCLSSC